MSHANVTALVGANLIDGNGGPGVNDSAVVMADGRVTQIGARSEVDIPSAATVIDVTGKTVMPGLINCHAHLCMDGSPDALVAWKQRTPRERAEATAAHALEALRTGITTIRDLRGWDKIDVGLRSAINDGIVAGPRLLISGQVSLGLRRRGPEQARRAARERIDEGFDVIKVTGSSRLTYDELRAVIDEADRAGKPTATHALAPDVFKESVRAGISSVEHGFYLDAAAIEMMQERGTYFVPTLASLHHILANRTNSSVPEYLIEMAKRGTASHLESFRLAREAGVRIAAGNDGGSPFNRAYNLASELELMVEAGMSPAEALMAAQKTAAELLRLSGEIGTLERGKIADVVVLDADPLANISAVRRIHLVFKSGLEVSSANGPVDVDAVLCRAAGVELAAASA
jgi:imidazolonepropionase-like amidohydrolase